MVHLMYALKRDGKLGRWFVSTLRDAVSGQYELEKDGRELGIPSPKSEVKRVIVVVLPRWITRFVKDRV